MNEPSCRQSARKPRTYLLVHGAFHGGWAWKQVAALLRVKGDNVYAPTLTGLGERSHLLGIRPTLETFIEDIVQVIRYEDLSDIILVGHSFAGAVVTGVADRYRDHIRSLVYVDAMILQDEQSALDTAPPALIEIYRLRAGESGSPTTTPNGP